MPKFNQTTQPIESPSGPVIHEHYAPSYVGLSLVAVGTAIFAIVFSWFALVYLFSAAGYRKPEMAAAQLVLILGLVGTSAWGVGKFIISSILTGLDNYYQFRLTLAENEAKAKAYEMRTAAAPISTGRTNEKDLLFMRRVVAVMFEAYDYFEKNGKYKGKVARPWSRARVLEIVKLTKIETTWTEATAVASWLRGHGVITEDDQINDKDYPALSDVQALLSKEFDRPILLS